MDNDLSMAPSAGADLTAGAETPAPSVPSASPEPVSDADAIRAAMSDEDPAEGLTAPAADPEAKPTGEGADTPEAPEDAAGEEGEGKVQDPAAEAVDELADLDFANLPAARKEYLKRDPEARAAWFFRQQMADLEFTVPEARAYREVFSSSKDAQEALKRAVDFGSLERAFASEAPDAHLQALAALGEKFGPKVDNLIRTVAENLDAVNPAVALERDAQRMTELLSPERLAPANDIEREALDIVWEMLGRKAIEKQPPGKPEDPRLKELAALKTQRAQEAEQSRVRLSRDATAAGEAEMKKVLEGAFAGAKEAGVDPKVLSDISSAVFGEVRSRLVEHPFFQQQFQQILNDAARTPEQRKADCASLVLRWAKPLLVDLARQRVRPYTRTLVKTSQKRIAHAKDLSSLAEIGGGPANVGRPTPALHDMSLEDAARTLMR